MGRPVIHFEIGVRDKNKSSAFYGELFDWKIADMMNVKMIDTGAGTGIQGHINALGHEPHHYTIFYVEVDDVQKYLDRAVQLGGRVCVPVMEVPGAGWFAWFTDPDGNSIGLWKNV